MFFLKTKYIQKFLDKHGLSDDDLRPAIDDLLNENFNASLGAKLYKVRVQGKGSGKSGGFRTIWFWKKNETIILMHFFAKNKTDNITTTELKALKILSKQYEKLTDIQIQTLIKTKAMLRINYGDENGE